MDWDRMSKGQSGLIPYTSEHERGRGGGRERERERERERRAYCIGEDSILRI